MASPPHSTPFSQNAGAADCSGTTAGPDARAQLHLDDAAVDPQAAASEQLDSSLELQADDFVVGRELGSGSFATVYMVTRKSNGKKYVIKCLDRLRGSDMKEVQNEVDMMVQAGSHPNVVSLKGWFRDPQGHLCLLLEFCEGGTLAQQLKGRSNAPEDARYREDTVMCWFVQLLMALHHLHGRRILHRDIKPDNIFTSRNQQVVKMGDLGIAKSLEGTLEMAITMLGTPFYMSPEIVAHRAYTYASDIWSLGCVLYEMAARHPPFEAIGFPQLMVKILRNSYKPLPSSYSRPFQHLVNIMLRADPEDRPTTADLLLLPFVRKHIQALIALAGGTSKSDSSAPSGGTLTTILKDACEAVRKLGRQSQIGRGTGKGTLGRGNLSRKASLNLAEADSPQASPRPSFTGARPSSRAAGHKPSQPPAGRAAAHGAVPKRGAAGGAAVGAAAPVGKGGRAAAGAGDARKDAGGRKAAARKPPAKREGGAQLVNKAKQALKWDAHAQWEQEQQRRIEARFQAREYEQRLAREMVRQKRKEQDPAARAREAERDRLQQRLQEAKDERGRQGSEPLPEEGNTEGGLLWDDTGARADAGVPEYQYGSQGDQDGGDWELPPAFVYLSQQEQQQWRGAGSGGEGGVGDEEEDGVGEDMVRARGTGSSGGWSSGVMGDGGGEREAEEEEGAGGGAGGGEGRGSGDGIAVVGGQGMAGAAGVLHPVGHAAAAEGEGQMLRTGEGGREVQGGAEGSGRRSMRLMEPGSGSEEAEVEAVLQEELLGWLEREAASGRSSTGGGTRPAAAAGSLSMAGQQHQHHQQQHRSLPDPPPMALRPAPSSFSPVATYPPPAFPTRSPSQFAATPAPASAPRGPSSTPTPPPSSSAGPTPSAGPPPAAPGDPTATPPPPPTHPTPHPVPARLASVAPLLPAASLAALRTASSATASCSATPKAPRTGGLPLRNLTQEDRTTSAAILRTLETQLTAAWASADRGHAKDLLDQIFQLSLWDGGDQVLSADPPDASGSGAGGSIFDRPLADEDKELDAGGRTGGSGGGGGGGSGPGIGVSRRIGSLVDRGGRGAAADRPPLVPQGREPSGIHLAGSPHGPAGRGGVGGMRSGSGIPGSSGNGDSGSGAFSQPGGGSFSMLQGSPLGRGAGGGAAHRRVGLSRFAQHPAAAADEPPQPHPPLPADPTPPLPVPPLQLPTLPAPSPSASPPLGPTPSASRQPSVSGLPPLPSPQRATSPDSPPLSPTSSSTPSHHPHHPTPHIPPFLRHSEPSFRTSHQPPHPRPHPISQSSLSPLHPQPSSSAATLLASGVSASLPSLSLARLSSQHTSALTSEGRRQRSDRLAQRMASLAVPSRTPSHLSPTSSYAAAPPHPTRSSDLASRLLHPHDPLPQPPCHPSGSPLAPYSAPATPSGLGSSPSVLARSQEADMYRALAQQADEIQKWRSAWATNRNKKTDKKAGGGKATAGGRRSPSKSPSRRPAAPPAAAAAAVIGGVPELELVSLLQAGARSRPSIMVKIPSQPGTPANGERPGAVGGGVGVQPFLTPQGRRPAGSMLPALEAVASMDAAARQRSIAGIYRAGSWVQRGPGKGHRASDT